MSGRFNLEEYEPVEERITKFWAAHPSGAIRTTLISDDGGRVVFRAEAYKDAGSERPDATGYADETKGSSNVNRTNHVENCETSAIGRALANLGFAVKGKRPSREEMQKAARGEQQPSSPAEEPKAEAFDPKAFLASLRFTKERQAELQEACKAGGIKLSALLERCHSKGITKYAAVLVELGEMATEVSK